MTGSSRKFVEYYEKESLSAETRARFITVMHKAIGLARAGALDVLDVGCGAGTQAMLWAELGHRVHGIDINAELVGIARERARRAALHITFEVGTATRIAHPDDSIDVCLMPELLEHVPDWSACVGEAVRVLRPGGVLYLSTTNLLCPRQQEFELPFYSWYPKRLKRRFEKLAVTTRPGLVQHATYPAVNWFTPYALARSLRALGMRPLDRFDMIDSTGMPAPKRWLADLPRHVRPLRFFGHMMTPGTVLFAVKAS